MLIQFLEQDIYHFLIPEFSVSKGELVVVQIPDGAFFNPIAMELIARLTGEVINGKVKLNSKFTYVRPFRDTGLRRIFFPTTVDAYIKKCGNKANPVYNQIYQLPGVRPETQMKNLSGNVERELSVYIALSNINPIIFHLRGVGPVEGQKIYALVKKHVDAGGAAILIDHLEEFMNDCRCFVKARYLKDETPPYQQVEAAMKKYR